jgi:hypothetical protein
MKRIFAFCLIILLTTYPGFSQSPQAFKYQTVVRNSSGEIVANQSISIRLSIRNLTSAGTIQYREYHNAVTNAFGLVNVEIGEGIPLSGSMTLVTWNSGNKYLQVELDINGGNNSYITMGTSQILSVPYSLYAETSGDHIWEKNGSMAYYNDGNVGVGTSNPGSALDVAGRIWQTGIGHSVFLGERAGFNDDLSNNQNIFIGYNAGQSNTTGYNNLAIGGFSLNNNTTGSQNLAIGDFSLYSNIGATGNTSVGYVSLTSNTSGSSNTALGYGSLYNNLTGSDNTSSGFYSQYKNETGNYNISYGYYSLYNNLSGTGNVALGYSALRNTTGNNNIAIGSSAGYNLTSGSNNILIGCDAPNATASNQMYLGEILYGNLSNGNIGIGTTSPNAPLSFGSAYGDKILLYDAGSYMGGLGFQDAGLEIFVPDYYHSDILFGEKDITTGTFTERVRINYNGYIGIGTSSPSAPLSFGNSSGTVIHYFEDSGTEMGMFVTSNGLTMYSAEQLSGGISLGSKNAANQISTHLRVNNNGRVGIGTTSPSAGLHIKGNGYPDSFLFIEGGNNSDAGIRLYEGSTDQWHIFNNANSNGLHIYNHNVNTVFFAKQSNGYVGIGTTSPEHSLHVNGSEILSTGNTAGFKFRDRASSTTVDDWVWYAWNDLAYFYKSGFGNIWTIANDGKLGIRRTPTANMLEVQGNASKSTAGSWLANSDKRIKTNILDIENASETIMKLRPVKFKYSEEWKTKHPEIGDQYFYNYIAQEFREVFPEAVHGSGEYLDGDKEEILQLDSYNAQIVSIKAIQEIIETNKKQERIIYAQQKSIDQLMMEVNALKNTLNEQLK